jgi:hypothetical protein
MWYTLARSWSPVPLAFVLDEVGLLTVHGPNGLLSSVVEFWRWCLTFRQIVPYLSGGWAGAEKSVEMCSIPDLLSYSFFAYECTMFCPRRAAMRQVTFERNFGSNLTD